MTELEQTEAWRAQLRVLPRELEPRRDLWPGIEARLAEREAVAGHRAPAPTRRVASWMRPGLALAASIALVALVGLLIGHPPDEPAAPAPAIPRVADQGIPWAATVAATELEYRAALLAFTPVTRAAPLVGQQAAGDIQGSWAEMQQAEIQLLAALEMHPDHRLLAARLIDLRARQLGFLRRLHRLEQERLVELDVAPNRESGEPVTLRAAIEQPIRRKT